MLVLLLLMVVDFGTSNCSRTFDRRRTWALPSSVFWLETATYFSLVLRVVALRRARVSFFVVFVVNFLAAASTLGYEANLYGRQREA